MTFEQLMESCKSGSPIIDNNRIYKRLLKDMKGNVTPVIGAGLSLWAGYPLWANLLAGLAGEAEEDPIRKAVQNDLNKNKFEKAASRLEEIYCHNEFMRSVVDEYSPEKLNNHTRPSFQWLLPRLFHGPVVTTNFDVSLEKLFDAPPVITPEDGFYTAALRSKINDYKRLLVKLHGSVDDPDHIILTEGRYNKTYGDNPEKPDLMLPLPEALHALFQAAPTLFLGCGLGNDRTCAVLKACVGKKGYALLPLPKETENKDDPFHPVLMDNGRIIPAFQKRRKQIDELNLQPIWYPYNHHEAVEVLIEHLAADLGVQSDAAMIAAAFAAQEAINYYDLRYFIGRDTIVNEVADEILDKEKPTIVVYGVAGIGKTEICKAAYRKLKEKQPEFRMPFINLAGTNTILEFNQKIAEGLGIHAERLSLSNINDLLTVVRTCVKEEPIYVYLDSFEDIWASLSPEEQNALSDNLGKLTSAGLQLLISSQSELPFGKNIRVKELDEYNDAYVRNLLWRDVLELSRTKLFLDILGRTPRDTERDAFTTLIAETSGHPLSIILTASYAKDCSSLETLPSHWHSIVHHIVGDRDSHDNLSKSLALSWSSVRQSHAAMMRWALHANCMLPLDENTLSELRRRLKKEYTDSEWIEGDRILRRLGLTFSTADGSEFMLMSIKKPFSGLDELAKQLFYDAFEAWIEWCGNLLKEGADSLSSNNIEKHRYALKWLPQCYFLSDICIKEKKYSKLSRLWQNASVYYRFDIMHSLHLLEDLARHKPDDYSRLAKSMGDYASILAITDQPQKALAIADYAVKLCLNEKDSDTLKDVLISRAEIYRFLGQSSDAESQLNEAEKLCAKPYTKDDKLRIAQILYQRCCIQKERGDLHQAEKTLFASERYYIEDNNQLGRADVLCLRADLMKDQENAILDLCEAEQIYKETQYELGQARVWNHRGRIYNKQTANHSDALDAFMKASTLFRKLHHNNGWVSCLENCVILSLNSEMAIESVIQAEDFLRSEHDYTNLSELLSFHGDCLQKNNAWAEAIPLYNEAAELFRHAHVDEKLIVILGSLDLCYQKTNNPEFAKRVVDEMRMLLAKEPKKNDQ